MTCMRLTAFFLRMVSRHWADNFCRFTGDHRGDAECYVLIMKLLEDMIMKKVLLALCLSLLVVACGDSGGGSSGGSNDLSVYDAFPMTGVDGWGQYTTLLDESRGDAAQICRRYSSVTAEQLAAYGNSLKSAGYTEAAITGGTFSGYIRSTGGQGYVWAFERYNDGSYLVTWLTETVAGVTGTVDSWPAKFNKFPEPPANGYTYIQLENDIVRLYGISAAEISQYTSDLRAKGFIYNSAKDYYTYSNGSHLYGCAINYNDLAYGRIYAIQWHIEAL